MNFKQQYLCQQGPFPFNFQQQRQQTYHKIQDLLKCCHPNQWILRGINAVSIIQSFKQVYGMKAEQLAYFVNYFLELTKLNNLGSQAAIHILKTLNIIKHYKIDIKQLVKVDNLFFLQLLKNINQNGSRYPLKSQDPYIQELVRVIRHFSIMGQQCIDQVLQLAIEKRQIKYVALFVPSLKNQTKAKQLMQKIFAQSSIWDRDGCWYYIINEITKRFQKIDYKPYYQTIFQQIIKIITTIINPMYEAELKKIISGELLLGIPSIIKSIANILVNLLLPIGEPGWDIVWSCIQRIFSLITSTLDHFKQTEYMNDFLIFLKQFVKVFQQRYRKQRKMYEAVNQDVLEQFHGKPNAELVIGQKYLQLFDQLWMDMIPQLLYLEDSDVRVSKLLNDLGMFNPQKYLSFILQEISAFLQKDLAMVSLYTCKMTILFLQEFILTNYSGKHQISLLFECYTKLLVAIQKLGVSQNLDILQLIMRCFIHIPESEIDNHMLQNLIQDIIDLILNNLNSMSINLQNTQGQQAEVYMDFRNIYLPFILRLSQQQIREVSDKILYKIKQNVPEHKQAYQYMLVGLCYVNKQLPKKILDHVYKHLITTVDPNTKNKNGNMKNGQIIQQNPQQQKAVPQYFIIYHLDKQLHTQNQQHIRWYTSLIQCAYQYHPENIVKQWQKLQAIVCVLLRQWDKGSSFDWGLDILFNLIICLGNVHVNARQFRNDKNRNYNTIKGIQWKYPEQSMIKLILLIKQKFYNHLMVLMEKKYGETLRNSEICKKFIQNQKINIKDPQSQVDIQVSQAHSIVINSIFCSQVVPTMQDLIQKKNIFKALSIQYSIFSAMQQRAPYTPNQQIKQLQSFYIKELSGMRKQALEYLKWTEQLMIHYNITGDQSTSKTWNFFWREAHDQLFYTMGVSNTNDKLHPFFYPHLFKKKQIFHNSFLILTEMYVTFFMRAELHCLIRPIAYLNDPIYLNDVVKFNFYNCQIDVSFKSIVPTSLDVHQQCHRKVTNLCRYKFGLKNAQSYIQKYKNSNDNSVKQRYLKSLHNVVLILKKNQSILLLTCCSRDLCIWQAMIELLDIYPYLQKKGDKSILIQILYLILLFCFDNKGTLFFQPNDQAQNKRMNEKIHRLLKILLKKIQLGIGKVSEKNFIIYTILALYFSQFCDLNEPVVLEFLKKSCEMMTSENIVDQINLGKTIFFRIMNRILKKKTIKTKIQNTPIKRPFSDFLIYRHLGGEVIPNTIHPDPLIKTQKLDNYFYPLKQLQKIQIQKLSQNVPIEKLLISYLSNEQFLVKSFQCLKADHDLKIDEINQQLLISQQEPKKVTHNGYKIINYILDANPTKLDIFASFVDNFSSYPVLFYHNYFRKMLLLGNQKTFSILISLVKKNIYSCQKQEKKLRQFLMAELLPFEMDNQQYIDFYNDWLLSCSNEEFQYANSCLIVVFCIDWRYNIKLLPLITAKLREATGRVRLRVLQILNNFVLSTGRFGRKQAVDGIKQLLKGIQEGADQVSQLIVSMLVSSFIIPINLELLPEWVSEPLPQLLKQKRIERINNDVAAFQVDSSIKRILNQIILKTKQEKNIEAKNLKIYSKISNKILSSITIYRFNDSFYELLRQTILYLLNKPSEDDSYDDDIIAQLKDSEYPQHIYENIVKRIIDMSEDKTNVVKKKLKFLQGVVINRSFCSNFVDIPDILGANQKGITIDHIITVSDMARIMKPSELTQMVNKQIKVQNKNVYMMMSLLLAAGNRGFDWRERLLNDILQFKKMKVVKEFISVWWKGKSPQTQQQQRLYMLVRSVQNPYTYFA